MNDEALQAQPSGTGLLGAGQVREIAGRLGVRPTKQWGQNFVVDANTVRRIVRLAGVGAQDTVVEVGPGLGSLTLALLPEVGAVVAVEVDPTLAAALPDTVAAVAPAYRDRLTVVGADALTVRSLPDPQPTALVANLPYNISVPVVLSFLEAFPSLQRVLVMVQLEVAERLAAGPGSKTYGVPSLKAAWYADVRLAGTVSRSVFWPVPNVDSGPGLARAPGAAADPGVAPGRVRLHRRRVRPAPQDPAGGACRLGRRRRPGRGGAARGRHRPPDAGRAAGHHRVRRPHRRSRADQPPLGWSA